MATPYSDTNSDDLAKALHLQLTEDVNIDLPIIDFGDAQYNLGSVQDNPLYAPVPKLELSELTTREVCGEGAFDALMEAYSKHIKVEHEKNRITGAEYAQAYVQLTSQAMSQAVQFLLQKDQAYWSSLLVQAQARAGQIAAIQAMVDLERTKAEYAIASLGVEKTKAEVGLTKMELALKDAQFDLVKTEDEINEYRLNNMMPVELLTMQEQNTMLISQRTTVERERDKLDYEITVLLPDQHSQNLAAIAFQEKQSEKIDADITAIEFNIQQMLPAQLVQLGAETEQVESVTAKNVYELTTLMPDQHLLALQNIEKSTKEVELMTFDIEEVKPVELQNLTAQTAMTVAQQGKVEYELQVLLPDEHTKNLKDIELADNQILKTTKDIEVLDFQLSDMLPAQLEQMTAEIAQITMQISKTSADRDNVVYQTSFTLPSQRENIIADTTAKQYQATSVMPSQVANTESDTLLKEYTRTQILPIQRSLTQEQVESKRAETMNTRTDGIQVTGTVGKQKDLYTQQISSYQRDSESKVARMLVDTWITRKGIDDGTPLPAQMDTPSLNAVITGLKANVGLT